MSCIITSFFLNAN